MAKRDKPWRSDDVAFQSLFLDAENPRLTFPEGSAPSPADLLAELVEHENVVEIAESIVDHGVYPHERLIAVEEDIAGRSALCVVEGNRRLAAMKALASPEALPVRHRARFAALAKKFGGDLPTTRLPVEIAPSRVAAMPFIVARHTHPQIRAWTPTAQASYFNRMRRQGFAVEKIAKLTGLTESDVLGPLRTHALYEAAKRLDLAPEATAIVRNPKKFPLSTLNRVFESSVMCDAIGARFEGEELRGEIHQDDFEKAFRRIVTDLAMKEEDSRSLSSAADFKSYLKRMKSDLPTKARRGRFKLDATGAISEGAAQVNESKKRAEKSTAPKRRGTKNVIPRHFRPGASGDRVQAVCTELRNLDLERYANASALLLRTLIDICVTEYMESIGAAAECIKKFREKDNKPRGWTPTLRQNLTFLLQTYDIPNLSGQQLNAAKRFVEAKDNEGLCLDTLDKFTHNAYMPPSPRELRNIWTHIEPMMLAITSEVE